MKNAVPLFTCLAAGLSYVALSCVDDQPAGDNVCEPEQTRPCSCDGELPDGTQVCSEAGWGECGCGGGDADSDSDGDPDSDTDNDPDDGPTACDNNGRASDPCIRYFGRVSFDNPAEPSFDWPGIYMEAEFEGTSVGAKLTGTAVHFDVYLDGEKIAPINGAPDATFVTDGSGIYTVAGLSAGSHTIKLAKRSETNWIATAFEGFVVDELLVPTYVERPKIEFIGDSYTVGYGNASPSKSDPLIQDESGRSCSADELAAYTDTHRAYGPLAAMQLGAEYQVNAYSGLGMVRHYNGSSAYAPFQDYYAQTLQSATAPLWEFGWKPDVVVVALGINDFSTALQPGESFADRADLLKKYKAAYHEFLDTLRSNYSGVQFVLWASNLWPDDEMVPAVQAVIAAEEAAGNNDVSYFHFNNVTGYGCDWHPDLATHADHATQLATLIGSLL